MVGSLAESGRASPFVAGERVHADPEIVCGFHGSRRLAGLPPRSMRFR